MKNLQIMNKEDLVVEQLKSIGNFNSFKVEIAPRFYVIVNKCEVCLQAF